MKANHKGVIDRSMIVNECLEALALVLEYNLQDNPTHKHAQRVGEACVLMADRLGLDVKIHQKIYYAGLLHDIGKISVEPKILCKVGHLTSEEYVQVQGHTVKGSRILASLPGLSELALWIRWHHERWDGSGYPDGLSRNDIPLEVQILGIVDCYDSIQTPRTDRPAHTATDAMDFLESRRDSSFNPEVLDLFFDMLEDQSIYTPQARERFEYLKEQDVNIPLSRYTDSYWEGSGMTGLYPILRLFARVIDAKHKYTRGHSTRVSILSKYIAEKMNLPAEDYMKVEVAGLLHDAGKVSVPIEILDKPGSLDEHEWHIIKGHPDYSFNILHKISSLKDIAEIAICHHERCDGHGYPNGLKESEINILSQIIAAADTYDAITSTRSYREAQPPEVAYNLIREVLGTQVSEKVGKILLDTSPKYINALFDMNQTLDE
jgi:putative nucleotidyltransferase with HDIG domain